jgi:hypothetical protein
VWVVPVGPIGFRAAACSERLFARTGLAAGAVASPTILTFASDA